MHTQRDRLALDARTRRALCVLLAALVLALVLLSHQREADAADWDVQTFVTLRDEAETLYLQGRYADAAASYRSLEAMIDEALRAGTIPEAQRAAATDALDVVRYQIGRSQQGLDECTEALAAYQALATSASGDDLRAKVALRIPETRLCVARQAVDRGEDAASLAALDTALAELASLPPDTGLSDDAREVLGAATEVHAQADALRAVLLERRLITTRTALVTERCAEARDTVAQAATIARTESQLGTVEALRTDVEAMCARVTASARPEPTIDDDDALPVGPIVLLSLGAALFAGDAIFEATLVDDDVEQYERLRDSCRDTGVGCRDALEQRDIVENERAISIAALSVGGALVVGGATWWIADALSDAEPSSEVATSSSAWLAPSHDGALVGLRWTVP